MGQDLVPTLLSGVSTNSRRACRHPCARPSSHSTSVSSFPFFLPCFLSFLRRVRDPQLECFYEAMRPAPSLHIIGDRDPVKRLTNQVRCTSHGLPLPGCRCLGVVLAWSPARPSCWRRKHAACMRRAGMSQGPHSQPCAARHNEPDHAGSLQCPDSPACPASLTRLACACAAPPPAAHRFL